MTTDEGSTEYDPLGSPGTTTEDLVTVEELFADAAEPFLASPWTWLAWSVLLPVAALSTPRAVAAGGWPGALALWSGTILLGGAVELAGILRHRDRESASGLGRWVLRAQGNLSLVALLLTAALLVAGEARAVPGLWLLLLGHSFFTVGGLGFPPFRPYGVILQLGGAVALWPWGVDPLAVFAGTTFVANLWMTRATVTRQRG